MRVSKASGRWYIATLGLATASSICLLTAESFQAGMLVHGYLLWNIILAWLPFGLALWLVRVLRRQLWSSWAALFLTVAWVVFLPNSFYFFLCSLM